MTSMDIFFRHCREDDNPSQDSTSGGFCKDEQQVNEWLSNNQMMVKRVDNHVDYGNWTHPIMTRHRLWTDKILSNGFFAVNLPVHLYNFDHCDQWFTYTCNQKQDTFFVTGDHPVPRVLPQIDADQYYAFVSVVLSDQVISGSRQAYNLFSLFSDLGGISPLFIGIGAWLNSFVSDTFTSIDVASGISRVDTSQDR